jgi:uncharacterized integral membrane protein
MDRPGDSSGDEPSEHDPRGPGDDATERGHEGAPSTPLTQQIGRVVVVLLLVLFVVFSLDNAQRVDFSWVLGATEVTEDAAGQVTGGVPLIVLLLLSFGIGAAVGSVAVWQVKRARRRRTADD